MTTIRFHVTGMHCRSCRRLIESVCLDLPGVKSVSLDEKTGDGFLEHDGSLSSSQLVQAIGGLGEYRVDLL